MFKGDKAQENIQRSIEFILVGTTHPGNIGAAARAMKNMGITRLSLVSPKEFPSKTAFYRSKKYPIWKTKYWRSMFSKRFFFISRLNHGW